MTNESGKENFLTELKRTCSRPAHVVLASLFVYVCLQNFFKWIPFPAGRTAFNLTTLEENLVSIIAGLVLFVIVVGCLLMPLIKSRKILKIDLPVLIFLIFLIVQVPLRDSKLEELARSLALGASILSSIFIGKYFSENRPRLFIFLDTLKWALLISVGLGIVIAVLHPASVHWGVFGDGPCTSATLCRAEFFFFTINPLILVVLLWRTIPDSKRKYGCQVAMGLVVVVLALMTQTRQYTLTIIATSIGIVAIWARDKKRLLCALLTLLIIVGILTGPSIFRGLLQYSRLVVDPKAVAFDPNTADWSSGRLQLLELLWNVYRDASIIGVGGVKVRTLIANAHLNARTEHGFAFYLATYGVFGLCFIIYIFWAFGKAVRFLWWATRGQIDVKSPIVALSLVAVPLFPFGFFGLFGAATNATDWLALVIASLICQYNEVV